MARRVTSTHNVVLTTQLCCMHLCCCQVTCEILENLINSASFKISIHLFVSHFSATLHHLAWTQELSNQSRPFWIPFKSISWGNVANLVWRMGAFSLLFREQTRSLNVTRFLNIVFCMIDGAML